MKSRTLVLALVLAVGLSAIFAQLSIAEREFAHESATSGAGTSASPYLGWEAAISADTEVIFVKGFYEAPSAGITLPDNVELVGVDGAVVQWKEVLTTPIAPIFTIPAGGKNVVIRGLQFEPGIAITAAGLDPSDGVDGDYIRIGSVGASQTVSNVKITNNRFGVVRYDNTSNPTGADIRVLSGINDLVIRENRMDSAPTNVKFERGHATTPPHYERITFSDNVIAHSLLYDEFESVFQHSLATHASYGTFDQIVIEGNTVKDANGTFGIAMPGTGLVVSGNNVHSANSDGFLTVSPPIGTEIHGVAIVGNVCHADDALPDDREALPTINDPSCWMAVNSSNNVTISSNSLLDESPVTGLRVALSDNVSISANVVNKSEATGGLDVVCYGVLSSTQVQAQGNMCIDAEVAFVLTKTVGDVEGVVVSGNHFLSTSTPKKFVDFAGAGVGEVWIRDNTYTGPTFSGTDPWGPTGASSIVRSGNTVLNASAGIEIAKQDFLRWRESPSSGTTVRMNHVAQEGWTAPVFSMDWLGGQDTMSTYAMGGHELATAPNRTDAISLGRSGDSASDELRLRGSNFCIDWTDSPAADLELCRSAAGELELSGGALRFDPRSAAPFTCDSTHSGAVYYDTDNNGLCLCGGSPASWTAIVGGAACS